jgi:hypothetical protein
MLRMLDSVNKRKIKTVVRGVRLPADKALLVDVVRERRGLPYVSDVIELAVDMLLVSEGLLKEAA